MNLDETHSLKAIAEYKGGATVFCQCGWQRNGADKATAQQAWSQHHRHMKQVQAQLEEAQHDAEMNRLEKRQ